MTDKPLQDPDLEDCMLAAVNHGEFARVEQARADFRIKLDRSIEQANAGQLEDIEIVWARLRRGLADLPHAAE